MTRLQKKEWICASALGLVLLPVMAPVARAGTQNLVTNGSFEQTLMTTPSQITTTNLPGWSTTGYNFLFNATTPSSSGQYGVLSLWTTNPDGTSNGFGPSPDGGNYIGADGAFQVGAITQTLNGLSIGASYDVSFNWAAAQQSGFTGPNSEQWVVSLGSQSRSTNVYQNKSQGFSGWMSETFTYTATATSEVLSFLAVGTPAGEPPFSLLDGVKATQVTQTGPQATNAPEPGTLAVLAIGLIGLGSLSWKRRPNR